MSFVDVQDLVVAYGSAIAVDHVSFTVGQGEHVTLLGPSGCGKTTTLRAIAGLEHPSSGRILIDRLATYDGAAGIDMPPERRGLSMVFQSYAIWPHMTVFDNVAFPFRVRGQRKAAGPAVERALALVDLAGFGPRPATRLSGGQQQRVALARAIAFGVKVILFDEPLSNLDAQLRLQMQTELNDLRRRLGFTAVYVAHDQDEAFSLSDRIVVMRAGRVEQQGTPASLHAAPLTRFAAAFLGVRNILDAEVVGSQARLLDGTVLPVACAGSPGPVSVAFRPTVVQFGEGQPARIARILFAGDLLHVFLRSGPLEICAYARPQPGLVEGETVLWRVAPEDCLVLRE